MATVDMNSVQFWTPSFNPLLDKQQKASSCTSVSKTTSSQHHSAPLHDKVDRVFQYKDLSKSTIIAPRFQGDGFATGDQDCDDSFFGCDDEVDDGFPSIEELWRQNSRHRILTEYQDSAEPLESLTDSALSTSGSCLGPKNPRSDSGTGNSHGTRDRPVILEDDEPDTPDAEIAAVSPLLDVHADSPFEPSTEPWYDSEDQCFGDGGLRPIPPLEQRGLASTPVSTPAQEQLHSPHHFPESLQEQRNLYDSDGITRTISNTTLKSADNFAELEREVPKSLDQDTTESTGAPCSSHRSRSSIEPTHPQIDQEDHQSGTNHGRLEELKHSCPLRSQDPEEVQEQQQRQEVVIELVREEDGDGDNKQPRQDGNIDTRSDSNHLKGSDSSINTSDEDDEDPRPAKRRKLPPTIITNNALTPLNKPASINNDQYHSLRVSRSPSATAELTPVAEYHEWPFQGFLKRSRIGNETMYTLEFALPSIQDHAHHTIPSDALSNGISEETPVEVTSLHSAVKYSKMHPAVPKSQSKRARWTPEEDARIVKMKDNGCSWEEIHAALSHRTQGTIQVRYSTKLKR